MFRITDTVCTDAYTPHDEICQIDFISTMTPPKADVSVRSGASLFA